MKKEQYFLSALLKYLNLDFIYINDEVYIGDIREARKKHKEYIKNSNISLQDFIIINYKKSKERLELFSENSIIDKETNIKYYFSFLYDMKNNINSETLKELAEEKILNDIENDLDYEYHKYFDFDWYVRDQLKYFDYNELDYKTIEVKQFDILDTKVYLTKDKDVFEEETFKVPENQLKLF